MNRRDLIIVAVLINCGLLIALFVGSVRSDRHTEYHSFENSMAQESSEGLNLSSKEIRKEGDQTDQLIKEFTEKTAEKEKTVVAVPVPVLTPPAKTEIPTPTAVSRVAKEKSVTVEKGDVLEKIAKSHGVKVDDIMRINDMKDSQLQVGQVLKIPGKSAPQKKESAAESAKYYIVKEGDSPWTIAQKNGIQVDKLLRLNNMDEAKAKKLRPGDKLRIR